MGKKVNFNKNKSNKLKLLGTILLLIFIIVIIILSIKRVKNGLNQIDTPTANTDIGYSVGSYTSLKDLLNTYNCKLLSEDENNGVIEIKVSFSENLYDGETSNERYFNNICKVVAEYEKYENFDLIDNSKNIKIEVKCEDESIAEIKINGDINYYLNHDSEINSKKRNTKITEFSVQSPELQALIDSNWEENKLNFGEKTSTCDGYNIYFEDGIKYKVVSKSIYNIIFTEKYENQVAGTLKTSSTPEEVINALKEPTFKYNNSIYGYLGKDNYIFFDFMNKQISVYPVVKISSSDEEKLKSLIEEMNKSNDVKKFSTDLLSMWTDYDVYDFDSNYVDLRYTLKGIKLDISSNSLKNGIFIYSNYSGDMDVSELENVYFSGDDLIFNEYKENALKSLQLRKIEGDFSEERMFELGKNFSVYFRGKLTPNESGYKGPTFYSRDKQYPDTELDRNLVISSYNWYDEFNFVYSIDDDGIYVFNPVTNENNKLIDVEGEININEAGDGKIVYNEDKEIDINMN